MRLLIYLLAMMTGFSAAEAARPVSVTPAELGSAVARDAVVAASVASVALEAGSASLAEIPSLPTSAIALPAIVPSLLASSPVKRHDITRQ